MMRPNFVCLSIICVACARSSALRSTGASGSCFFFGPWREAELNEWCALEPLPTLEPEPTAGAWWLVEFGDGAGGGACGASCTRECGGDDARGGGGAAGFAAGAVALAAGR